MRNLFLSFLVLNGVSGAVQATDWGYQQAPPCYNNYASNIDYFVKTGFLYWQFQQDNLVVGLVQDSDSVTTTPNSYLSNHFIEIDPDFTPGFEVGLGMQLPKNNWEIFFNYTRVHGSHSVASTGSDPDGITIYVTNRLQAIFPPEMGAAISATSSTVTPAYTSLRSTYHSNLDFVDGEVASYSSLCGPLTIRTAMGLRYALINQSLNSAYEVTVDPVTARILGVKAESHSSGIGPRFGADLDWCVGNGFSLLGSVYGDVLYTWYHVQDKTSVNFFNPQYAADRAGVDSNYFTTTDRLRALRTHVDMELGIHWGTFFCNNRYHLDISATYGFQAFFDQNMFRHWDGLLPAWSTAPHGNLYVNGLKLDVTFDF